MKDQLIFNTASAETIADSDSVGAYVRSNDGTLITHHNIGVSNKHLDVYAALADGSGNAITSTDGALDVNIVGSDITVNVDLDGVYSNPSNLLPDSAGCIFHTRAVTPTVAEQVQRTTAATLASILAADLSKIHALDVNSFMYGINDDSGDAELTSISNTNGGLNVNVVGMTSTATDAALANSAIKSLADSLAAAGTAEKTVATPITNRKYLFVYNNFNRKVFIGGSDVDKDNGFPVSPGSYIELRAGAAVDVYYDSEANGAKIRTLELS